MENVEQVVDFKRRLDEFLARPEKERAKPWKFGVDLRADDMSALVGLLLDVNSRLDELQP